MNYAGWAEMQQNPNPNTIPNSGFPVINTTDYSVSYSQNLNTVPYQPPGIDPHSALFQPQPQPPGVDQPYLPPPVTVQYAQQPVSYEPQPQPQPPQGADPAAAAAAADLYYQNASWAAAIAQFGATPYAATAAAPNPTLQSQTRNIWKKGPKKTKIVQSAWCEVCKIDCNSKGVLDQHKLGKKHKKNLEKLLVATTTVPASTIVSYAPTIPAATPAPPAPVAIAASTPLSLSSSVPVDKPLIGPQENPDMSKASNASKKRKKAAAARTEDLETKRRKVLEGGAEAKAVRLCSICNVVCNSDTVFNYHLAGQKHASMVKKLTSTARVASAM